MTTNKGLSKPILEKSIMREQWMFNRKILNRILRDSHHCKGGSNSLSDGLACVLFSIPVTKDLIKCPKG